MVLLLVLSDSFINIIYSSAVDLEGREVEKKMNDLESIFIKLLIAGSIGIILGLERELRRKPLGLKTSAVIAITSCLITIISIESAYHFPGSDSVNITMDPMRLTAQIVSGIGFIGAGVIMKQGGLTITGLTTAALIWASSGLGIAVGAGFWKEAIIAFVMLIVCVEMLPNVIKKIGPMRLREKDLLLKFEVLDGYNITDIHEKIKEKEIEVRKLQIREVENGVRRLEYKISTYEKRYTSSLYEELRTIDGITKIDLQSI
jgi:putative Mg2+ transporter-C (MgtC) family protein